MSVRPSQPGWLSGQRLFATPASIALPVRWFEPRLVLSLGCLICVLIAEGAAITQSYLWAIPLLCLLFASVAIDLPLVPFLGLSLLVRVLTDDSSSVTARHSGSIDLSGLIAGLMILVAVGLLLRRRQAAWPALLAALWLGIWTVIAIKTDGASATTIREGVRETSIVALAVIVFNSRGILNISLVTRIIQIVGLAPALLALYQLVTHTGFLVGTEIRSNGTFSHPNSAAVFFAVVAMASLWRLVDNGHRRSDALFTMIYVVATIATFSLGGLASLLVMLVAFGLLRPGSLRLKLGSCAIAGLVVVAFLATPLGSERIASESSTNFGQTSVHGATNNSSLGWRFYKWRTLIPEWEKSPLFGRGLGTTVTSEGTAANHTAGNPPHSELFRYLVETGAIGLIILLAALMFLLRALARRRRIPATRGVAILGMAIVLGLLVDAVASNTFLYTPAAYASALIVAAVLVSPGAVARAAS